MQIEAILKPKKVNKSKKKRKDDEEVLDRFADEEVSRLRESMLAAAADDDQANRDKSPATSKLKLLPQVMEVLRKCVQRHIYLTSLILLTELRSPNPSSTTTFWKACVDGSNPSQTVLSRHSTSNETFSLFLNVWSLLTHRSSKNQV